MLILVIASFLRLKPLRGEHHHPRADSGTSRVWAAQDRKKESAVALAPYFIRKALTRRSITHGLTGTASKNPEKPSCLRWCA
jgi:hypothetical protein